MSKLKPCPFCNGEAEYGLTMAGEEVYCKQCGAVMPRTTTEEDAIQAWNTRACDECERGAVPMTEENMSEHGWVKERTCEAEYRACDDYFGAYYCTACDNYMDENDHYCPTCGARVVEE